jgi:glycosyltransferase involved in cell wall biosynthesis
VKIAYVIDALHTEGAGTESQLRLLIDSMQARGNTVSLHVLRHTDYSRHCEYPCTIQSVGFASFFSPASWLRAWRFRRWLARADVDVVHGFFNDCALLMPILLSFTKAKRYTSRRDMGIWYSFLSLLVLRLNALTDCEVICNSKAVLEHTHRREWLATNKLHFAYNAVHVSRTAELGADAQRLKTALEAKQAIAVCMVANIKPLKQFETLVEAAKLVADNHDAPVQYHFIGAIADPDYASELKVLIEEYGLTDSFHFNGPIPQARNILSAFDIGVLSSASEGLSNTIIEYLQAGLPAVVSRTGGNPELVSHQDNGLLFAPGNAQQLAIQLGELIASLELRQQLGRRAIESTNRFSIAAMCEAYEQIYSGNGSREPETV